MPEAISEHTTNPRPSAHRATAEQVRQARERVEAKEREELLERRLAFSALFSEWLRNRAAVDNPAEADLFENDDYALKHGDRETELAFLVTTTPAPLAWMIWQKFEVLEHYLCGNGEGTSWTGSRELVMLASIKADLIRFKIEEA